MKKNTLVMEISVYLGCFILIALGDGIYRHFSKGLSIADAFRQVLLAYGTLFVLIGIVFVVVMLVYFMFRMSTRKKDKVDKGNSNDKI